MFSDVYSAISNWIQHSQAVGALIPFNSYHDSTVARHWEPHVVRVAIDGILRIAIKIQKLFISVAPFLCEDLHMLTYIVSVAAFYCCIDQNLLCCGWYRVRDVV